MSRRRLPIAEWEAVRRLRIACFGLALCIMDWAMNTFVILCDYMMSRVFVKFAKPLCILELLMICIDGIVPALCCKRESAAIALA